MQDNETIRTVLENQKPDEDIFITKYSDDEKISNIILDFDGADHKEEVYNEVRKVYHFLRNKGLNSVIVSSTNKGYHFYIQIPTVCFDEEHLHLDRSERNRLFVMFTENLVKKHDFKLRNLDPTNTNAGLGGNIRLLGSIHPKTHEKVKVVLGEFIDLTNKKLKEEYYEKCSHYVRIVYKSTIKEYHVKQEIHEKELEQNRRKWKGTQWEHDPIRENDLRDIIPQIYGGTVKKYNGYIFMQCPWHVDRNPSLKVTKEWYYCTGCGAKGNIWTLIKKGEVDKGKL